MKMKKTAAAVLAAAVLAATPATVARFSPISVTANAADILTEGDYKYSVNEDGETVTITEYTGTDAEVDIPATLDGKVVTVISSFAFFGCTSLTSITIPNSVTSVGGAFSRCSSLTTVTIPDSVTSISGWDFEGCSSLNEIIVGENNNNFSLTKDGILFNKDKTELICYPAGKQETVYEIPDGVTSIGDAAFDCCSALTSITIPSGVTSIGDAAFNLCSALTSITIPGGVMHIGDCAFDRCSALTSITVPDSVTLIGDAAFSRCSALTDVYYGGTKKQWDAIHISRFDNQCLINATIHFSNDDEPTIPAESTVTPGDTDPVSEPENSSDSSTDEPTVLEATLKNVDSENGLSGEQLDKLLFGDSGWTWAQVEKIVFTSDSLFSVQYTAVDGSTKTLGEKTAQRAEDDGIWNTEWTLDTSLMSKDNSFVKLIAKDGTADIKATIYIKKDASKPSTGGDQANTGIALAIAPIALAASAVVVASKKKK